MHRGLRSRDSLRRAGRTAIMGLPGQQRQMMAEMLGRAGMQTGQLGTAAGTNLPDDRGNIGDIPVALEVPPSFLPRLTRSEPRFGQSVD